MNYKLLDNDKKVVRDFLGGEHTLYRIQDSETGFLGGYIESRKNLGSTGKCWIGPECQVYGNAVVRDDARLSGKVYVYGGPADAAVLISDNVRIGTHPNKSDETIIINAHSENVLSIRNNAAIFGSVEIEGNVDIANQVIISQTGKNKIILKGTSKLGSGKLTIERNVRIYDEVNILMNDKDKNIRLTQNAIIGNNVCIHGGTDIMGHAILLSGDFIDTKIKDALFLAGHGAGKGTVLDGNVVIDDLHWHLNVCNIHYDGPLIKYNGSYDAETLLSADAESRYLTRNDLFKALEKTNNEFYADTLESLSNQDFYNTRDATLDGDSRDLL